MATKVLMEALSPTMEEGRLVEWKKGEGDPVAAGEILAEVETDKAVMDLQARASGVLLRQVVQPGTTVPVGQMVGVIGTAGEDIASLVGSSAPPAGAARPAVGKAPQAPSSPPRPPQPSPAATVPGGAAPRAAPVPEPAAVSARVRSSPLARRIAAERGLDLSQVAGSGPDGRIVARDLETAVVPAPAAARPRKAGESFTDVPLSQMRKTIARRLGQSLGPIPTFYLTAEFDMERMVEARQALVAPPGRGEGGDGVRVSINDIILKATALALREHPACNAWWQEDRIRYWNEVHLGVAVAVEEGLVTPVVRNADQLSLREIATTVRELAGRARERRLSPAEYTGATFSVSNLGMYEIDQFTAVINPPEAGILAVGSVTPQPVADGDRVSIRRRMRVTLSCDHRVIDGATGAAFLQTLRRMLENPLALVW